MTKFEEFFGDVPNRLTSEMRKRIMEEAGVSSVTFNNWRSGAFKPVLENMKAINTVCVEFGYPKLYEL